MLKKILFTAFLVGFAFSADAQIATPQLDSGFHTYGGAAAGWRYGNTVAITGISVKGKVENDGTEVGDITAGLDAGGPEDSSSPIPFALAAFRGESLAGELYSNLGDGLKTDAEIDGITNIEKRNNYSEEKELRINLAYVLGETLSIGLGYSSENDKTQEDIESVAYVTSLKLETDVNTVGTSLSASYRLADIFFVAAGMESVKQTGTSKSEGTNQGVAQNYDKNFVENSWTNTMYGLGVLIGDPGETQFRVEYSMISSPESEEKDDTAVEENSLHPQTTTTFISVEAKFGDFLLGYLGETENEAEIGSDPEIETITTSMGIGWVPLEGLSVSLYSLNNKQTTKRDSGDAVANLAGFRFFIGYNF